MYPFCSDLDALKITKLGEKKKLLLAVKALNKNAQHHPIPQIPTNNSNEIQAPAQLPLATSPPQSASPSLTVPNMPNIKHRSPRRCRTCHHFRGGKHDDCPGPCPGWENCPTKHIDGHREEKTRLSRAMKEDKKKEREKKVDEDRQKKRKIAELLAVRPAPTFEEYFDEELKKKVEKEPERYSMEKGSAGWLLANQEICSEWSTVSMNKKRERDMKRCLKRLKQEGKSLDEQLSAIESVLGAPSDT